MIDYIKVHKDEFEVEPICRVLSEHGMQIAPSTYYDNVSRRPSKSKLRDEQIVSVIAGEHEPQKFTRRFRFAQDVVAPAWPRS